MVKNRIVRWALRLTGWLMSIAVAVVVGFTIFAIGALPPLQRWHTERLAEEFDADRHAGLDFAGYLQLEDRLFEELRRKTDAWVREDLDPACVASVTAEADSASAGAAPTATQQPATGCDTADEALVNSRFYQAGWLQRLAAGAPYNRSFRLPLSQPRGQALLLHGLTDSPYSVRALAQSLHGRGFDVTVLRLPGHGSLPSMLTRVSVRDWTAAVRLAVRDVAARAPAGMPFYIGGYSSGGTLAMQYALDALQDASLRRPDRVLLVSPAIELTRVASLTELIDLLGVVPLPVLDKVHWQEIVPEFDPYKYNSFPVNAARQINRATRALQRSLADAEQGGRLAQLPPVVAWQSVVDSTVGSNGVANRLFARLQGSQHRLVLFDINRLPELRGVARPAAHALIERLATGPRGYSLDIVSNADTRTSRIGVWRLAPDGRRQDLPASLDWPASLVSLGHVALPFPPDDPVYGFMPGSGRAGIASIGSWLLRGESGAITIGLGSLTRLRSNPFWPLIDEDVATLVAADQASAGK